jgi:pectinesterase
MRLALILFLSLAAHAADVHVRVSPGVKTGTESTTEYPTIQMAMDHHPDAGSGRVFIHIAPGTYHERVIVTETHPRVTLIGMGKSPADVVITNSLNATQAGGTFFTETVQVNGEAFQADDITFENTAGNTGQAVAIAVRSDRAIFKNCRFLGHQDTLFADFGRQYYVDSYIEGTVDFIFGNAAAVFDRTEIHELSPGYLTAHSRTTPTQPTGYIIINSKVTADETGLAGKQFYLGRPWRPSARTLFIHTELPSTLNPEGWSKWTRTENDKTAFYGESGNTGPGSNTAQRAPWTHQLTSSEITSFLPANFLRGSDGWNPEADAKLLP